MVIPSKDGAPYVFQTVLGWCVVGHVAGNNRGKISCNKTAIIEAGTRTTASHHFGVKNDFKETDIKKILLDAYHNDFTESTLKKGNTTEMDGLSVEGKRFLSLVEEGTELVDGHYHEPLPLRNPYPQFPNNKTQAVNRLNYLGRRFVQDEKFFADYRAFIEDMISKGYA